METKKIFSDLDLNKIAEDVWRNKGNKATLWDVLVQVLAEKANTEPFIIWMTSDFAVIEMVARGHGADYIANVLEVPKREILNTCTTWGMECFSQTLDFDPVLVYTSDMTMGEYKDKLRPALYYLPDDDVLEDTIINVEKYRSVKKLLDEWRE
jgi:hypothetical protein